jgi:hypothetical protein
MPMLRFELFQLCHDKIKSQLSCFFISEVDLKIDAFYENFDIFILWDRKGH